MPVPGTLHLKLLAAMALASIAPGTPAAWAGEPALDCPSGTGFIVLMGQDELYLNKPARRGSVSGSIMKSILASALTGGSYLVGFYPQAEGASIVAAPQELIAGIGPATVARSLDAAFSTMPAAAAYRKYAPVTEPEVVDDLIFSMNCASIVVVNALYTVETAGSGVQLSLAAQVLEVPAKRTGDNVTLAALEYRSRSWPFEASRNVASLSGAFEQLLVDRYAEISAALEEAGGEVARMLSRQLQPEDAPAPPPLGRYLKRLDCDLCEKSDLVVETGPARLWLRPKDEPLVTRSVAVLSDDQP